MRKLLTSLILCATLSSCGALDGTIDKGVIGGKELVTHTTGEIGKLKEELKVDISEMKTEILDEVGDKIEEITPKLVDQVMNTDAVAFLIVSVTLLLGLVVIVALLLLVGASRALYKRLRHPRGCSAR